MGIYMNLLESIEMRLRWYGYIYKMSSENRHKRINEWGQLRLGGKSKNEDLVETGHGEAHVT